MSTDRLLTPGEVARIFRVSTATVDRWIDQNLLPGIRIPGGKRRVAETVVRDYLEKQQPGLSAALMPNPLRYKGPIPESRQPAETMINA